MKTLADMGYDRYFRRSLPQDYQTYSAVNYDSLFEDGSVITNKLEDGSIGSAKISSIRFDQIQGGKAILGGANNQSGQLSVRDESNVERVKIDKSGISVSDDNGNTMIDANGVVSTSNFPNFGVIDLGSETAYQIIDTENTYTTVSDGIKPCQFSITVDRTTKALIMGRADIMISSLETDGAVFTSYGYLAIKVGGVIVDSAIFNAKLNKDTLPTSGFGYAEAAQPTSVFYLAVLPAGTTSVMLQAKQHTTIGSTKLYIAGYNFSYFLLGT